MTIMSCSLGACPSLSPTSPSNQFISAAGSKAVVEQGLADALEMDPAIASAVLGKALQAARAAEAARKARCPRLCAEVQAGVLSRGMPCLVVVDSPSCSFAFLTRARGELYGAPGLTGQIYKHHRAILCIA